MVSDNMLKAVLKASTTCMHEIIDLNVDDQFSEMTIYRLTCKIQLTHNMHM